MLKDKQQILTTTTKNKGLISQIYKELLKKKSPTEKLAKAIKRQFSDSKYKWIIII